MSRPRFVWLAIAALVAICGALYLGSQRNGSPRSVEGALILPALAHELDTVTALDIRKGAATPSVSLHRAGDAWTVAQRADYPADASKVRKLLLALGDAKIVEEKTSNPANFSIIGVEDPAQPGATGVEITVSAKDGKHAIILGKPVAQGDFARRAGENRSFTIEPAISVESEPRFWIDSRLIDVPTTSIQSVEIKPPGGPGYVVRRLKPNEDGFALEGTPAGRKPLEAKALAPSATTLSGLTAEDVAAAADIDFSKPTEAIFTLSDGGAMTLIGTAAGDKRWLQVKSTKDAALAAKTQNRAFEIASYRYDSIFRPLDQLLVPKESKPAAKPAIPGHKPEAGAAASSPKTGGHSSP